jgi:hypothetical protein
VNSYNVSLITKMLGDKNNVDHTNHSIVKLMNVTDVMVNSLVIIFMKSLPHGGLNMILIILMEL